MDEMGLDATPALRKQVKSYRKFFVLRIAAQSGSLGR
jgi:hypothetical protein